MLTRTVNTVPRPGSLSTSIVPPISETTDWAMESPSPVPSTDSVRESCSRAKGSKTCAKNSGAMPQPVSAKMNS